MTKCNAYNSLYYSFYMMLFRGRHWTSVVGLLCFPKNISCRVSPVPYRSHLYCRYRVSAIGAVSLQPSLQALHLWNVSDMQLYLTQQSRQTALKVARNVVDRSLPNRRCPMPIVFDQGSIRFVSGEVRLRIIQVIQCVSRVAGSFFVYFVGCLLWDVFCGKQLSSLWHFREKCNSYITLEPLTIQYVRCAMRKQETNSVLQRCRMTSQFHQHVVWLKTFRRRDCSRGSNPITTCQQILRKCVHQPKFQFCAC